MSLFGLLWVKNLDKGHEGHKNLGNCLSVYAMFADWFDPRKKKKKTKKGTFQKERDRLPTKLFYTCLVFGDVIGILIMAWNNTK